jgi:hypothetical protein
MQGVPVVETITNWHARKHWQQLVHKTQGEDNHIQNTENINKTEPI